MNMRWLLLMVAVLMPFMFHCNNKQSISDKIPDDCAAWRTKLAEWPEFRRPENLVFNELVFEVGEEKRQMALKSLQLNGVIALSEEESVQILGRKISTDSILQNIIKNDPAEYRGIDVREKIKKQKGKLKPFLVRAIRTKNTTGGYYVKLVDNNKLFVSHYSLGGTLGSCFRSALVIFLEEKPEQTELEVGISK